MGFLTLLGGGPHISIPDFSQAIISLWFRIPSSTIAAAQADWDNVFNNGGGDIWTALTPLLTFGPTDISTHYSYDSNAMTYSPLIEFTNGPSILGVTTDLGTGVSFLSMWLQYTTGGPTVPVRPQNDPPGSTQISESDYFFVGAGSLQAISGPNSPTPIAITAEHWHHVLVSFDLSNGCSCGFADPITFDQVCKFWLALDDVNKDGLYLGPLNDIVSGWSTQGLSGNPNTQSNVPTGFAAGPMPTNGHNVGVPSDSSNSTHVQKVELAEFQMWTGQTLDTSVTVNRRLFLNADGSPVNPLSASTVLGTPDILLTGQSNWQVGRNTGTAGNLNPTGTINPFTPGPQVGA